MKYLTPPPFYEWLLSVQSALVEGQSEGPKAATDSKEPLFLVQITCQVAERKQAMMRASSSSSSSSERSTFVSTRVETGW